MPFFVFTQFYFMVACWTKMKEGFTQPPIGIEAWGETNTPPEFDQQETQNYTCYYYGFQ